jgi:hypothetical protein
MDMAIGNLNPFTESHAAMPQTIVENMEGRVAKIWR